MPLTVGSSDPVVPAEEDANPLAGPSRLPLQLRGIFTFIPLGYLANFTAISLIALLSAVQVQGFDPEGKVGALGLLSAIAAFAAFLTQPIVGTLSDRTRTRFGARSPWILAAGATTAVGLITAGFAPSFGVLVVANAVLQIGVNAAAAPMSALLPERVPPRLRGRYSTFVGLGTIIGGVFGSVFGGSLSHQIPLAYCAAAGLAIIIVTLAAVFSRGDNRGTASEPFKALTFIKAFWVDPVKHPDFFWAFLGRILIIGGFNLIGTYNLYILQDYIGLPLDQAVGLVPVLGVVALPGLVIAASISGPLSDRIGRRKPLVLGAGVVITLGAIVPLLLHTVPGLLISYAIAGLGFGIFTAVDQALMASVLPSAQDFGKDLGVINMAQTLPGVVAPAVASTVVLIAGYPGLYAFIAAVALIGALAVIPIRSVR